MQPLYLASIDTAKNNNFWSNLLITKEQGKALVDAITLTKPLNLVEELRKVIPNLKEDTEEIPSLDIIKLCEECKKSSLVKKWKLSTILNKADLIMKGDYRDKTAEEIKALAIAKNKARAEEQQEEVRAEEPPQEEDDGEVHCFD